MTCKSRGERTGSSSAHRDLAADFVDYIFYSGETDLGSFVAKSVRLIQCPPCINDFPQVLFSHAGTIVRNLKMEVTFIGTAADLSWLIIDRTFTDGSSPAVFFLRGSSCYICRSVR